jgi:hypothetical protein
MYITSYYNNLINCDNIADDNLSLINKLIVFKNNKSDIHKPVPKAAIVFVSVNTSVNPAFKLSKELWYNVKVKCNNNKIKDVSNKSAFYTLS